MLDSDNLIIYEDVPQRSELWHRLRAGHLTASNFDRLLTPTGRDAKGREDLIVELCCSCLRPDEVAFQGNVHTVRGVELEPEAREVFTRLTGKVVKEVGFIRRKAAPIGCSPDGLIFDEAGSVVAGLEIKCPLSMVHARYLLDGVLPAKYAPQVHGCMAVTGIKQWYFLSYCPGLRPFLHCVEWDEYTNQIKRALDDFAPLYLERYNAIMEQIKPLQ